MPFQAPVKKFQTIKTLGDMSLSYRFSFSIWARPMLQAAYPALKCAILNRSHCVIYGTFRRTRRGLVGTLESLNHLPLAV
jgi:hypothetical protein